MDGILETLFFLGFLYWFFPTYFIQGYQRVKKMVDIISNRMFDTFNTIRPRERYQNDTLVSMNSLRRFKSDNLLQKAHSRDAENKARDSHLCDIKENLAPLNLPRRRPVMGLSCLNCTPNSRESLVNKTSTTLALKNILNYTPAQSKYNLLHRTFNHLSQVYELRKFPYPQVEGTVFRDERIRQAIQETALQQFKDAHSSEDELYQELLKTNEKRARKLLRDMRSTLSDFLLRFTSWVLYKLLPCFLTSVVVHPGHVDMIKKVGDKNIPLIFLPLHRSHLDYILMSFILLNNNIRSPLVAAGDNLRIPFFGSLLRGLGAFFIKRRVDPIMGRKDQMYKAVLHTYMNECLRAGHNIEFFLEGGRTRTGKPCMPKYGILSVIVESFMDNTIEDALLVPVSINYEKLVDGNFIREQLGQPKQMETFGAAIKGIWHVLNSNYGMMRIDFNQPFSLRELVKTFNTSGKIKGKSVLRSNPSTTSLYGTDVVSDEHKTLVESISKHVLFDCVNSQAIMSTNAVTFLLLNKFRNGVLMNDLVTAVDDLKKDLISRNRDIGFTGDSFDVINYVIEILGAALIRKEKSSDSDQPLIKPISILPNVIELAYYSNSLLSCYALESIVALALHSLDLTTGIVQQDALLEACQELCDLFQYEFIFCKPCQNLDSVILNTIDDLVETHQIFEPQCEDIMDNRRCHRIASELADEDDLQTFSVEYRINPAGNEHLAFLRGLLTPLVEGYAIAAFSLDRLVGQTLLEKQFIKSILDEMKQQLVMGTLKYQESVSVDPIKNALKVFQKWDILDSHSENKDRIYYLTDRQDNSESVTLLYKRISKYRSYMNPIESKKEN